MSALVASDGDAYKELFQAFLRSVTSQNTRMARARDLGIPLDWVPGRAPQDPAHRKGPAPRANPLAWLPWCLSKQLPLPEATVQDVERWLQELREAGYANSTRGRMLSHVSGFYQFLMRPAVELVDRNPADPALIDRRAHHLNKPRNAPPKTQAVSMPVLRALLEAAWLLAPRTRNGRRDRAMTEILVTTGIREDELVGVNLGDYYRSHPGASATLLVHGKGERDRWVLLEPPVADAVDDYLVERVPAAVPAVRGQVGRGREDEPLFVTDAGRRVRGEHVQRMLRRICATVAPPTQGHPRERWKRELLESPRGIELGRLLGPLVHTLHPHQFRHSYASIGDERGVDIRQLQRDLGHADIRTTLIYIHHARGVEDSAARELSLVLHRGWWQPRTAEEAQQAQRHDQVPGQISIDDDGMDEDVSETARHVGEHWQPGQEHQPASFGPSQAI